MGRDHLTQSYKGPDDKEAHLNSMWTIEDVSRHDRTVLCEGVGQILDVLSSLQDHRLLSWTGDRLGFAARQTEHEIAGKLLDIPLDSLVEHASFDPVDLSQIRGKDDALAADYDD